MMNAETSTTTTNEQTTMLVLKDGAGNYFLVPQETLEQGRVPEKHKAELERLIAEASTSEAGEGDDTQGHLFVPLAIIVVEIAVGAAVLIGTSGPEVRVQDPNAYPTVRNYLQQMIDKGEGR